MTLSDYLRQQNLTASAFAARAGVSKAAMSRWLSGQRAPTLRAAQKLFAATNGAVDVLATTRRHGAPSAEADA